jgi:hypothetical protein
VIPESDWSQFIPSIVAGLVIMLVGGVIAFFKSKRFNIWVKNIISGLKRFVAKFGKVLSRWIKFWREYFAFVLPVFSIGISIMLLAPDTQTYYGFFRACIIALVIVALLAIIVYEPPMNSLTSFLIFCGVVIILIVFSNSEFAADWPVIPYDPKSEPSIPDVTDIKTVSLLITLVVLSAIWVTANTITSWVRKERNEVEEKFDLLYEAPGVSEMLEAGERELFGCIFARWNEFLEDLEKRDKRAAQRGRHAVPVEIKGYTLKIGCQSEDDVNKLVFSEPITSKISLPAPLGIIQQAMREFFNKSHLQVICVEIGSDRFEDIKEKVKNN